MNANVKAGELKTKLFNLINECKGLQLAAQNAGAGDNQIEATGQLDSAACGLAKVYESLGDLFIDAHRDTTDQSFSFAVGKCLVCGQQVAAGNENFDKEPTSDRHPRNPA